MDLCTSSRQQWRIVPGDVINDSAGGQVERRSGSESPSPPGFLFLTTRGGGGADGTKAAGGEPVDLLILVGRGGNP